jgi:undecaprenyl-diphosphatase
MHEIIKLVAVYFIAIPIVILGVLFGRYSPKRRLELVRLLVLGAVASYAVSKIASHFYFDPRPFTVTDVAPLIAHSNDNGFPSDHTLFAAMLAWVALAFSRKVGVPLLVVALLIGAARVAAGVHHWIDILGGFLAAAIGVTLAYAAIFFYEQRRSRRGSRNQSR